MTGKQLKRKAKSKAKVNYVSKIVLKASMIASVVFFTIVLICTLVLDGNNLNDSNKKSLFDTYVIVSESMIPTIGVNDAIVVKKTDDNNLEIGDIITFSSKDYAYNGLTVTHRIVGIQNSASGERIYRTKGDNNVFVDTALVDLNSIYGKVVLIIPKFGYIKNFLTSIPGFITLIIMPILMVIVYEIYRIRKLLNKQKREITVV